ncbi:MAG: 30S ribosomal protein S2 [bacterium]|nr:30S ribosomal protein S2 [bacterium]
MVETPMREMLEAGVHFGHQRTHWNPKMKPFIYGERAGIHIINLQKTVPMASHAFRFVAKTVSNGGNVLFVGTKKQAQDVVESESKRCGMFFVNHRWLGGTLTNFQTIKSSIDRLKEMEKKRDEGLLEGLTKKEKLWIERAIIKLTRVLGGIREMNRLPEILFLIDPSKEHIAKQEAGRLGIPIVALADTNCDPEGIDYLIPGNDDATKSIRLFVTKIADACLSGVGEREQILRQKMEQEAKDKSLQEATQKRETVQEKVVAGRAIAYVSKAEKFEGDVSGSFKGTEEEKGGDQ